MKFICNVKEISYGTIEVEANSPKEAQDKAEAEYMNGNTIWSSGEYEIEAEEVKEKEKQIKKLNPLFFQGIAHRGIHDNESTENSLGAFKKAVEYGIEAIETDVWICKDGVP